MTLPFLHYDVFTDTALAGNQLAVFPDGSHLTPEQMQAIAREMNFSESTFVLPAERPDTDVRMRIFTPALEMPMAGHPTIGSTFALAHTGAIAQTRERFVFGLNIGPTPVDLEWDGPALRFAWMTQRNPEFGPAVVDRAAVAALLGVDRDDLHPDLPAQKISCGVPYMLVPLRDRAAVDRVSVNASEFKTFNAASGLAPEAALFVFSISGQPDETVYSRMLAPQFGVAEDPATGSASGPLGCYLVRHGVVSGGAARHIISAQGVAMQRPSRIYIAIEGTASAITNVKVGGTAVLVGRGELLFD
jgi:trans-2,3-dihydro-3-hydroxyanthranilate isomerase